MATDHSVNRTWKYLSFALIGILAAGSTVGFIPQASAHITTNVQHMLEHIYSFVDGIEAKTNNLPADPASNTVVNTRASQTSVNTLQTSVSQTKNAAFTQVITEGFHTDVQGTVVITCTSNADFLVDFAIVEANPNAQISLSVSNAGDFSHNILEGDSMRTLTVGSSAGETIEARAFPSDPQGKVSGFVTMRTAEGAVASCVPS